MSLDLFFESKTPTEIERRNRIRLSIAAFAYEFEDDPIMSDGDFDKLSFEIRPKLATIEFYHSEQQRARYEILDEFFRTTFQPHTGMWIRKHPELDRLAYTYWRHYAK